MKKILSLLLSVIFGVGALGLSSCSLFLPVETPVEIKKVTINDSGELIVVYTDGSTENLGVVKGTDGATGAQGEKGEAGKDGSDGKDGVDGKDGADGKDGVDGKDGADGKDGENGKSAYELYKDKFGYEGTEEEWLQDLVNGELAFEKVDVGYKIGTIAAASGLEVSNSSRILTQYYIPLENVDKVTIGSGFELTWFAYDAQRVYLGNGNNKTANWLGSGVTFSSLEILSEHSDAVYIRFALRKTSQQVLALDDVYHSAVKIHWSSRPDQPLDGVEIKYEDDIMSYESVAVIDGEQDGAIYNGYLFRFQSNAVCHVYSMKNFAKISTFTLDKSDVLIPHCNAVCFSDVYYEEGDEFPVLYSNIYNSYASSSDRMEGTCCAYRIVRNGDTFTSQLLQVIQIGFTENLNYWKSLENNGDVRAYGNFVVDTENDSLYAFTMRNKDKTTRFFRFDLPKLTDGIQNEVYGVPLKTLNISDIKEQFDCAYFNYIQGACYYDGKIYSVEGFSNSTSNVPTLRVIDLAEQNEIVTINLSDKGLKLEPEFIDFYNGTLYYGDANGALYTVVVKALL